MDSRTGLDQVECLPFSFRHNDLSDAQDVP